MIEFRWLKRYHNYGPGMARTTKVLQYRNVVQQSSKEQGEIITLATNWQDIPEVWEEEKDNKND